MKPVTLSASGGIEALQRELSPYSRPKFNVAVIGAGPAGAALAIALARQGLAVVLFSDLFSVRPSRVEILREDAAGYLDRLGVGPAFASMGFARLRNFGVDWGSSAPRPDDFLARGWLIDPSRLNQLLVAHAATVGVLVILNSYHAAPTGDGKSFLLQTSSGRLDKWPSLLADFVVDATGRKSFIGTHLGATHAFLDGLVARSLEEAHVPLDRFTTPSASVLATEHGWWFLAACPKLPPTAIFFTDVASASARPAHPMPEEVRRHIPRGTYFWNVCADSRVLSPVAGDRWLAVGDAAFTCDPLSGAGLLQALATAAWAADLIPRFWGSWPELAARYAELVYQRVRELVAARRATYGAETRWPDSPFWKARHELPATRAHA